MVAGAALSRIVESILLELPIPQIFVIENASGIIELIDGLQRVSSVIQFIEPKALELEPLRLFGCDLITDLNGKFFEDLSLMLKLRIKRSSVRTVVIKRQSSSFLRYEMFKRLNTGGSGLMPQEIRNCTARIARQRRIRYRIFAGMREQLAIQELHRNTVRKRPGAKGRRGIGTTLLRNEECARYLSRKCAGLAGRLHGIGAPRKGRLRVREGTHGFWFRIWSFE